MISYNDYYLDESLRKVSSYSKFICGILKKYDKKIHNQNLSPLKRDLIEYFLELVNTGFRVII